MGGIMGRRGSKKSEVFGRKKSDRISGGGYG